MLRPETFFIQIRSLCIVVVWPACTCWDSSVFFRFCRKSYVFSCFYVCGLALLCFVMLRRVGSYIKWMGPQSLRTVMDYWTSARVWSHSWLPLIIILMITFYYLIYHTLTFDWSYAMSSCGTRLYTSSESRCQSQDPNMRHALVKASSQHCTHFVNHMQLLHAFIAIFLCCKFVALRKSRMSVLRHVLRHALLHCRWSWQDGVLVGLAQGRVSSFQRS